MRYTIDKHERYVVIEPLVSFLDSDAAAKLKGEFLLRNTAGQRNIVLNLEHVEDIIEGGMRMGLLAHRLCESLGGLFILVNLQPQIEQLLKVSKLDKFFTIVSDMEEAEDMIFANEIHHDLRVK